LLSYDYPCQDANQFRDQGGREGKYLGLLKKWSLNLGGEKVVRKGNGRTMPFGNTWELGKGPD